MNYVAFSGGKDSTALVLRLAEMGEDRGDLNRRKPDFWGRILAGPKNRAGGEQASRKCPAGVLNRCWPGRLYSIQSMPHRQTNRKGVTR